MRHFAMRDIQKVGESAPTIDVEAVRAAANYLRNHRGELPRPTDRALQTVLDAFDHHQSMLAHYESELRRVFEIKPPSAGPRARRRKAEAAP